MTSTRWPTRDEAQALLFEFTQSDALRKHGRAVEEAMRACARRAGVTDPAEIERWGIVGMLHDFDYEQNPTEDTHLHVGGRILRERGYAEEMVEAIQSHADYMKIPRDTPAQEGDLRLRRARRLHRSVREGPARRSSSPTSPPPPC